MNAKVKKARDLISNELWQSFSTSAIKVDDLKNAESAISKLNDQDLKFEFKALCEEEISDNQKNPIIPRYLATLCGRHPVDDNFMFTVFDDYYKDNRFNEVKYVGNVILSFNESPYVIKALAECYGIAKEEDNKISCLEKLIRVDANETDAFYSIAEYHIAKGEPEIALNYYKRVAQRHINQDDLLSVKEVWPKMLELKNDNVDYFIQLAVKIAKKMGSSKGVYFLNEVFHEGSFDNASNIRILKKILELDSSNKESVEAIVGLYREKYAQNPRLEYCLANTGLLHDYMDAFTAVENFEKEIEFTEGAFVFHKTWGLGRIRKIEMDEMQIQFISQKDLHKMSCSMAFSSLKVLPKQHIMVLKAGATAQQIKDHLMSNVEWGLKMLLNSYNGKASFKQLKAELNPSIMNDKEWSTWQAAAKKELEANPYFSTSDESNDIYVLRETPITFEEKTLQVFQRERGFFKKYAILKDFVKKSDNIECEEFGKMLDYLISESKTKGCSGICSIMILESFKSSKGLSYIQLEKPFAQAYAELSSDEVCEYYADIEDTELRKSFIDCIVKTDENWPKVLIKLLHVNPSSYIVDYIKGSNRKSLYYEVIASAADNYQQDPDFLLFFLKNATDSDWKKAKFEDDELLFVKLQLLLFINGKVLHDVDAQVNRVRAKQLIDELWGNQEIVKYLSDCDTSTAKKIYSYVTNIPGLDEDKTIGIKHYILSNRKDADSIVGTTAEVETETRRIPKGFLCTRSMFMAKSAELEHIMNVEIPENSKEIGTARDLGDLRENAEYQYAKDKQKNLNFMMNKLTDEIDIAKIIDPENVDVNYVEFGTKVVFADNINKTEVFYTVLGPWESNPDKNILNFQAPLGQKIYNMTKGENKKFVINEVKFDLTVKSIELADFNLN